MKINFLMTIPANKPINTRYYSYIKLNNLLNSRLVRFLFT